ncbi:MAG: tRNA (N(6)-L-threonylcarbamoyladenosine(37)-C(2))-methylthiotransferase MtaB [Parasporobacterium sp.]|nr:tRNA (N(6)-L-threonylcarbamoyladenosine(37)-C(2))-methylthiotransferase MtaB [Parasporobacterium sp.]
MKVSFHTLGCKTNAYETQAIREQFLTAGYELGEFSEPCDVYVINTCAVTAEAARKSRQMTGRCKRKNPQALVVVTGCYAQEAGEELLRETMADLVVGNSEKNRILPLVQDLAKGCTVVKDLSGCREYEKQSITLGQEDHVRAYVKIQDGCDRFCSYCLIPFLRGRSRSRDREDILQEVRDLAASGCQEIVLTGIDISSFRTGGEKGEDLVCLLEKLDRISGVERIRLGSLEEGIISKPFLERLVSVASFCPQFHLSLQSGSNTVLKRMNRHYTAQEFYQAVEMIRERFPNAGITTDIITGFPGETEEEFEETMAFARKTGFSRLHVFPYSRREGTRADQMPGQLTRAVREERAARLIRLGEQLREQYECRLIGKTCHILAEECVRTENGLFLAGYTPEYVRILLPVRTQPEKQETLLNRIIPVVPKVFQDGCLIAE